MPPDSQIVNLASSKASGPADLFPCGLVQPAGSFRFGLDALLLAALARETGMGFAAHKSFAAVELGSGCGAALLGLGLTLPNCHGLGLEREAALVTAARQNAALLGLQERIVFACQDLGQWPWQCFSQGLGPCFGKISGNCVEAHRLGDLPVHHGCPAFHQDLTISNPANKFDLGKFDLVLANPPYATNDSGRHSPSPCRERALRDSNAPALFCQAASRLLRHHGHFVCIFAASGLTRLLRELGKARLGLRRLLPMSARSGRPAIRVLVHARKNAADDCQILPPLVLHEPDGSWSREAIAFCPWLT